MHRSISFLLTLCVVGLIANGALAKPVQISGQHGEQEIRDKCGSSYVGTTSTYGCTVPCKGGECSVQCDRSTATCKGTVPSRVSGGKGKIGTVGGVLTGAVGNAPPKGTTPPKRQVGVPPISVGRNKQSGNGTTTMMHNSGGSGKH